MDSVGGGGGVQHVGYPYYPTFNMKNYPMVIFPKLLFSYFILCPTNLFSTWQIILQLTSHKLLSSYFIFHPLSHNYSYMKLAHVPILTPPSHQFTRVATGSTSGLGPILSFVPANAKVGRWDLESDLKKYENFTLLYHPTYHTNPVLFVCLVAETHWISLLYYLIWGLGPVNMRDEFFLKLLT
jgi:hypothetical protein